MADQIGSCSGDLCPYTKKEKDAIAGGDVTPPPAGEKDKGRLSVASVQKSRGSLSDSSPSQGKKKMSIVEKVQHWFTNESSESESDSDSDFLSRLEPQGNVRFNHKFNKSVSNTFHGSDPKLNKKKKESKKGHSAHAKSKCHQNIAKEHNCSEKSCRYMELVKKIGQSLIGDEEVKRFVYGDRAIVYADWTASGRSISFIEDVIHRMVMPNYANTHTEASATGQQTSLFRHEARELIAHSVNASDDYAVIFCGSGATGAIDKLVGALNIRIPANLDDEYKFSSKVPQKKRPIVFHGPYEHHSNILPWRESLAEVIQISCDQDGRIDLESLRTQCKKYRHWEGLKIGSFSAASNVTGILSDTTAVSSILHEYGFLSFWDYAAACPYVNIDVQLQHCGPLAYMDAIFMSPHKMPGGPGSPGVLVARKELFTNRVPVVVGGGTVEFVASRFHVYIADIETREEGGTPAIIESIRAGLAFKLKDEVGAELIHHLERTNLQKVYAAWADYPQIRILGNTELPRLCIVSFVIYLTEWKKCLNHNLVVALLNDLFGIQARGGCSCAGPYGLYLLGVSEEMSTTLARVVGTEKLSSVKPGWARLNFNYFVTPEVLDFIINAVIAVSEHGWRMIPYYNFDVKSGSWEHMEQAELKRDLMSLKKLDFLSYEPAPKKQEHKHLGPDRFKKVLQEGIDLMKNTDPYAVVRQRIEKGTWTENVYSDDYQKCRSFLVPEDFSTENVNNRDLNAKELALLKKEKELMALEAKLKEKELELQKKEKNTKK